ncbi:hypothetical protein [Neorhizobium alkalisoli]|uniref:Uncharacterized protein n=1 Tax=Neorhizobium alkalisoli TaxID=528178 RepID=A0A561QSF7_9HYPH|nr:hypothetical protein [Neorhizobium alkalisoli]TWF53304.1 hypothetical protein FHW37_104583 [Neorhizobium alkalisoli]
MTAINVLVSDRRVQIVSDGAASYRGRLHKLVNKVVPVPHLSLAVAFRGKGRDFPEILRLVGEYSNFDDLKRDLPKRLRKRFGWRRMFGRFFDFDIYIGHVGAGVASAVFLCSHNGNAEMKAYEWTDIPWVLFSPDLPADDQTFGRAWVSGLKLMDDRAAVDAVDRQRSVSFGHDRKGSDWGGVGGFVQITTIGGRGIEQRIVKRYSDQVGEMLGRSGA